MLALLVLSVCLFFCGAEAWCAPGDQGECALTIRAGRRSTDSDGRSIRFVDSSHSEVGLLRVTPRPAEMSFFVGGGAEDEHLIMSLKADGGILDVTKARINDLGVNILTCASLDVQQVSVAKSLRTNGTIQVEGTGAKLHVASSASALFDGEVVASAGLNVEQSSIRVTGTTSSVTVSPGEVVVFSQTKDAHVDLRSSDTSFIRAVAASEKDGLLLHGRKVVIDNEGRMGVGVDSPTHALHVNGFVRAASSTITTVSDARLKRNIQPVDTSESLRRIKGLRVRDFEFINALHRSGMRRGFIAQEVESVVPEAVHTADEDHLERFQNITIKGLKTLDMERIIFELVGAVQQLSKEVGELRKLGVNA